MSLKSLAAATLIAGASVLAIATPQAFAGPLAPHALSQPADGLRDQARFQIFDHAFDDEAAETTGSLGRGERGGDLMGRDASSAARGNADFPERAPEAQNLGGTSGGPRR